MDQEQSVLKSPMGAYTITKELGRTKKFNLYLCQAGEVQRILKIAASVEQNGLLDREALLLRDMREEAARLEGEYALVMKDPNRMLNYHLGKHPIF